MSPNEFWNTTYKSINKYVSVHLIKDLDSLRRDVNLQEAVTNKLIQADSMTKHPKIVPIRDSYEGLFEKKEDTAMTAEEITRKMRSLM